MVSFVRSSQNNCACKNSEKFTKYSQSYDIMCQLALLGLKGLSSRIHLVCEYSSCYEIKQFDHKEW